MLNAELAGLSILIVEDEPEAREMLVLYLDRHGATTRSARSVADALAAIAAAPPDLVISDLAMPGEDGYSLIEKIRGIPHGATIPIISLSGFASPDDARRALAAGFQMHVSKPVKLRDLLASVSTVLAMPRPPQ